jgi:multiple sugar transport system substrate-binding protein
VIKITGSDRFDRHKRGVKQKTTLLYCFWLLAIFLIALFAWIVPALTQQVVTVSVLMLAPEAAEWRPIIKEFHQKYPNIRVEIVEGPNASNQIEDLYTSSFLLGNSPYDLVFMDIVWGPKFAAAGWLMDLSERISPEVLSAFLDGDVNGGRYQGKLYRMPLRSDAGMLYYRKDLLEKAGYQPPETFEELLKISQSLQQQKLVDWGYLWQGKQYEGAAAMFVEILKGYGGFWVDASTLEVGLDRPEAIQAVQFLRNTIAKGISPPGSTTYAEEETRLLFQNGESVFLRSWPYVFSLASQEDSKIRGQFGIKPMVSEPGRSSGACQGGWGLGIATSSKHPDEAWKVIEYLSSEEAQRQFVLTTSKVPSLKSLFNDPAIVAKFPYYPQLLEVVQNAALRPPIAQYAQASDILQRYLSAALTNAMSPEKAMKAAANETRRLLER